LARQLNDLLHNTKLFSVVTQPLAWAAVLFVLALFLLPRRPVAALWIFLVAIGLTALIGWMPLSNAALRSLQSQYSAPAGSLNPFVGLVVLGGDIDVPRRVNGRKGFVLSNGGQRVTTSVALSRQYPHLLILFTAGEIEPSSVWKTSENPAQQFFNSMGVPSERVLYERKARTTYENAILSASVPGVDKTQPWLLLTSAYHMRRSMALFRAAGWNVTPYPVGFISSSHTSWTDYSLASGIVRWRLVLHEVMGLVGFTALGLADF
jgi:uncharacterized SAM-binding protein YcdF (DUF218 family)